MDALRKELDSLSEEIVSSQKVAGEYAIQQAQEIRNDVEVDLAEMTLPDAYERHLLDVIQEERERFVDGEREEPLCSCGMAYCPLKRGKLPAAVEGADDVEKGLSRYLRQHDGNGAVLKKARQKWVEKGAAVKAQLREALGILRRDPRPDESDEDDDADTEEVTASV